jgi:hypothetical protein
MHRGQIEAMKRAEREAAARVQAAAEAEPFDPVRHRAAMLEWQSARVALRSIGIKPRDVGPISNVPIRSPSRNRTAGDDSTR